MCTHGKGDVVQSILQASTLQWKLIDNVEEEEVVVIEVGTYFTHISLLSKIFPP